MKNNVLLNHSSSVDSLAYVNSCSAINHFLLINSGYMNIINVRSAFNQFDARLSKYNEKLPLIALKDEWKTGSGRGIVAGLLDTDFDENLPDLTGADMLTQKRC